MFDVFVLIAVFFLILSFLAFLQHIALFKISKQIDQLIEKDNQSLSLQSANQDDGE